MKTAAIFKRNICHKWLCCSRPPAVADFFRSILLCSISVESSWYGINNRLCLRLLSKMGKVFYRLVKTSKYQALFAARTSEAGQHETADDKNNDHRRLFTASNRHLLAPEISMHTNTDNDRWSASVADKLHDVFLKSVSTISKCMPILMYGWDARCRYSKQIRYSFAGPMFANTYAIRQKT